MSRILACLDASSYTTAVCDFAGWAAIRLGLGVELLHVVQRKSAIAARQDLSGAIGLGIKSELLEELTRIEEAQGKLAIESGRALLSAAEARLREASVQHIELVHLHGGIVETILERENLARLVVMGKRGASSDFASAHLGSKIERVLRASSKPLLACPAEFTAPGSIVIAYDGGRSSARAVDLVRTSPLFAGLAVHLLRAGLDTPKNRDELAAAVQQLQRVGLQVSSELVQGAADRVIGECMASRPDAMLVMGAYGHSPLRNLIIGSTTTATIRAAPAAIMLVR